MHVLCIYVHAWYWYARFSSHCMHVCVCVCTVQCWQHVLQAIYIRWRWACRSRSYTHCMHMHALVIRINASHSIGSSQLNRFLVMFIAWRGHTVDDEQLMISYHAYVNTSSRSSSSDELNTYSNAKWIRFPCHLEVLARSIYCTLRLTTNIIEGTGTGGQQAASIDPCASRWRPAVASWFGLPARCGGSRGDSRRRPIDADVVL